MIRLVMLLCAGLYVSALVLGADHGQKRYGLLLAEAHPVVPLVSAASAETVDAKSAVFIPAQPVRQVVAATASDVAPAAQAQVQPEQPAQLQTVSMDITPQAQPLPTPDISGGLLYTVAATQANVREGPSRSFAVVGSLTKGEQVLVVLESQPIQGWSRIRIEGDGIEGYISTKLLTRSE